MCLVWWFHIWPPRTSIIHTSGYSIEWISPHTLDTWVTSAGSLHLITKGRDHWPFHSNYCPVNSYVLRPTYTAEGRSHGSVLSTALNVDEVYLAQRICCFHSGNLLKRVWPQSGVNKGECRLCIKPSNPKAHISDAWWGANLSICSGLQCTKPFVFAISVLFARSDTRWQVMLMKQRREERRCAEMALFDHFLSLFVP